MCKVATEKNLENVDSLRKRKSVFSGPSRRRRSPEYTEEVEITEDEAVTIECPPTPGPVFNIATMTLEEVSYKRIVYFVTRKYSSCCSR